MLLVDLDAQANLTTSLTEPTDGATIYEAMTGKISKLPIVVVTEKLHLVPSSLTLAMADVELSTAIAREHILSEFLRYLELLKNTTSSSLTVLPRWA